MKRTTSKSLWVGQIGRCEYISTYIIPMHEVFYKMRANTVNYKLGVF